MSDSANLFRFGQQILEFEEPCTIIYRLIGTVQVDELRAMREAQAAWQRDKPYVLVLIDLSRLDATTMAARKEALNDYGGPRRAIVAYGGGFAAQVIAELVFRAIRMLGRDTKTNFMLTPDEARARAWLAEKQAVFADVP